VENGTEAISTKKLVELKDQSLKDGSDGEEAIRDFPSISGQEDRSLPEDLEFEDRIKQNGNYHR